MPQKKRAVVAKSLLGKDQESSSNQALVSSQDSKFAESVGVRGRKGRIANHPTGSTKSKSEKNKQEKYHRYVDEYSSAMKSEPCTTNPFAAFIAKPQQMRFASQEISESIVLVLRQAPISQLRWIIISAVLLVLPFFLIGFDIFVDIPTRFKFAGILGWYLITSGFILEQFLKWFYNVYILTDERVIDVDFYSLIHKSISAAKIDNIEDVTASTYGVLASIFDYGDVVIQTAAAQREFDFLNVPKPSKVKQVINELILEEEREKYEGRVN